jgi:hypothetical protein
MVVGHLWGAGEITRAAYERYIKQIGSDQLEIDRCRAAIVKFYDTTYRNFYKQGDKNDKSG